MALSRMQAAARNTKRIGRIGHIRRIGLGVCQSARTDVCAALSLEMGGGGNVGRTPAGDANIGPISPIGLNKKRNVRGFATA